MTLFNRDIINISRLPADTADGAQGYSRVDPASAIIIYSGLRADIQKKMESRRPPTSLPADIESNYFYEIFIFSRLLSRGVLLVHDYITDQTGSVYQVNVPYWTIFGYQAICERLIL